MLGMILFLCNKKDVVRVMLFWFFFFQAEDGIRDLVRSRGLGDVYKRQLQDKSKGVFNGKVMVRQDAQKTNAFQENNTILLSDDAVMNLSLIHI